MRFIVVTAATLKIKFVIPHNYKTFIIVAVLIDIVIVAIVCCVL